MAGIELLKPMEMEVNEQIFPSSDSKPMTIKISFTKSKLSNSPDSETEAVWEGTIDIEPSLSHVASEGDSQQIYEASRCLKKKKRQMNKHKHRKLLKKSRPLRKRLGKL